MIAHIAAISQNNCIGKDGDLPWHIPEDMERFKEKTQGSVVLMGRKTWESIPEKFRPLPERKNLILTTKQDYSVPEGVDTYDNIPQALSDYKEEDIFVIGGESVYEATMDRADKLLITHVEQEVSGCDAYYPKIREDKWQEVEREDHNEFSFVTYERVI